MNGELKINGVDAHSKGIHMGKGFINALKSTLEFKDDVETDSTKESGKRVILNPYFKARDVSLSFVVTGSTAEEFLANEEWLLDVFYARVLTIDIKNDGNRYRLVYTGKSTSYGYSPSRKVCTITAKFTEINPEDRGETKLNKIFVV